MTDKTYKIENCVFVCSISNGKSVDTFISILTSFTIDIRTRRRLYRKLIKTIR